MSHASKTSELKGGRLGVASNMVSFFSKEFAEPWKNDFEREKQGGKWAYRPKIAVQLFISTNPDDVSAIEADPRMRRHLERERNLAIVHAKRADILRRDGQLKCEACGFAVPNVYPGLPGDVCEVHHRLPRGQARGSVKTRLEDLAILCPNCHRAIHTTTPPIR